MNEQVLAALARYGEPALFVIVAVAACGIPLPVTLLLIVTGSLVAQGVMDFRTVVAVASAGSVVGDQTGYLIGKWGGKALHARLVRLLGSPERLQRLDEEARHWGDASVFFSRWLVTPLGPWINLGSGLTGYSWLRFTIWGAIGETFGCALFIWLGLIFSDRVQAIGALLGDLTWALVAILAAALLGWWIFRSRDKPAASTYTQEPPPSPQPADSAPL
jgi:membrane protein DedA with SNARE-associated domain